MTLLSSLMIVIGLVGIVVPVLPGLLLVWGGVALWSIARADTLGWVVLGVVTALTAVGMVIKYLLPGRRLRTAGVPWLTLAAGGLLCVVGYFVVPVVGLPLGFVLGVYLAERVRLPSHAAAWSSTRSALAAVGWSMVIEFLTALLVTSVWVAGLIAG